MSVALRPDAGGFRFREVGAPARDGVRFHDRNRDPESPGEGHRVHGEFVGAVAGFEVADPQFRPQERREVVPAHDLPVESRVEVFHVVRLGRVRSPFQQQVAAFRKGLRGLQGEGQGAETRKRPALQSISRRVSSIPPYWYDRSPLHGEVPESIRQRDKPNQIPIHATMRKGGRSRPGASVYTKRLSPPGPGSTMDGIQSPSRRKSEMRVRSVVLSVVSVMLLAFAVGCAKQEPPKPAAPAAPAAAAPAAPALDGKTLFDNKCGVCHGIDRATAATRDEGEVGEHRQGDAGEEGRLDLRRRGGEDHRLPRRGPRQEVIRAARKAHATGGSGGVAAGGGRPNTSFALLGYPRSRKNGGHSEVKRSRAGSTHGEPRTEPPLRGDAAEG